MRNERGITLVELLAVIALSSVILILLISVFINGSKAANRSSENQRLQQEANYIMETIRREYLKPVDTEIELKIDKENQILMIDGKNISEGYDYQLLNSERAEILIQRIKRNKSEAIDLTIRKGKLFYEVKTTFSKLR